MKKFEKLSYFKFVFADKKAFPYWIVLFFIVWVYSWYSFIIQSYPLWLVFLLKVTFVLLLFAFYFVSYFNYSKFFLLRNILLEKDIPFLEGKCKAEVFSKKINVNGFQNNFRSNIKLKSYKVDCLYLALDFGIVLTYYMRSYGTFVEYVKPIVILNSSEHSDVFKFQKNVIIDINILSKRDKIELINNETNNENIEKVVIYGFHFDL